jgi:hypothetical protein
MFNVLKVLNLTGGKATPLGGLGIFGPFAIKLAHRFLCNAWNEGFEFMEREMYRSSGLIHRHSVNHHSIQSRRFNNS